MCCREMEVKKRREKGKMAAVMGQVWGIGKRRFGKDWGRRLLIEGCLID